MSSVQFAEGARRLGVATRALGYDVPAFRGPPRLAGCTRSIQRRADGTATVSIRLKRRPFVAVLADMIAGVVAANRLSGVEAGRLGDQLWEATVDLVVAPVPVSGPADRPVARELARQAA